MTKLTLIVEPGETVEDASLEAQRIADMSKETVMFEFNGIECFAVPGGDPAALADRQQGEQHRKPKVFSD